MIKTRLISFSRSESEKYRKIYYTIQTLKIEREHCKTDINPKSVHETSTKVQTEAELTGHACH